MYVTSSSLKETNDEWLAAPRALVAEGLAIYRIGRRSGYLIASSQGDDTFHVFDRDQVTRHLGAFAIEGTGETDGHAIVGHPLGDAIRFGLFVNQGCLG